MNLVNEKKGGASTHLNLAICFSPFQAFIWTKIAKQKNINDVKVLYISYHDTKKDRYYVGQLQKSFESVEYLVVKGRLWRSIPEINKKLQKLHVVYAKVDLYVASFNTFFSMYIFNKLNTGSIFLFDDGVFSIISEEEKKPYRFNTNAMNFIRKIITRIYLSKTNDQEILKKVKKFYTLFPIDQTLVDKYKVEPVRIIFDVDSGQKLKPYVNTHVKVFIGDVISELTSKLRDDYRNILFALPIDYYLPHPRSKEICCPQGKEILLDMVAEDFIASMLSSDNHVTVYSFSSTVLFTLTDHPCLTKVMIKHPDVSLLSLYEKAPFYRIQLIDYDRLINKCLNPCSPNLKLPIRVDQHDY